MAVRPSPGNPFLPVVLRPLKNELLSSWLWRMASLYRLTPNELLALWTSKQAAPLPGLSAATIDESPTPEHVQAVAAIAALHPDEVSAVTLAGHFPCCPPHWFGRVGALPRTGDLMFEADPLIVGTHCPECFHDDHGLERICHVRAGWTLASHSLCPNHRCLLRRHCPSCSTPVRIGFIAARGRWHPICQDCHRPLDGCRGDRLGEEWQPAVNLLLRFETTLTAALEGRRIDAAWSGSAAADRLLRVVEDISWALVRPRSTRPKYPIRVLQVRPFVFRSATHDNSARERALALTTIENRQALLAATLAMFVPNAPAESDPLITLFRLLPEDDGAAVLERASTWPRRPRDRLIVSLINNRRFGSGRSATCSLEATDAASRF